MGINLIKAAICDNNISMCSDIENSILKYRENGQNIFDVEIYYSGKALCNDLKQGIIYDLIFLDIELGDINGVEVGHFIRDELKSEEIQIIYI